MGTAIISSLSVFILHADTKKIIVVSCNKYLTGHSISGKLPDYPETIKLFQTEFFNDHFFHLCFWRTLFAPSNKFLQNIFGGSSHYLHIIIRKIFYPSFNTQQVSNILCCCPVKNTLHFSFDDEPYGFHTAKVKTILS